jgi:hypothetical protein
MFVQQWRDGPDLTPARNMVETLHDWGLSDAVIALLIASTQGTVNKVRHGRAGYSGRNIAPRLSRLCDTINENYGR